MPPRFRKPAPRPGKTVRNGRKTAGKKPQVDINIDRSRYSYILPRNDNSDHPCYDIGKGERLLKDVYEALRVSQRLEPFCPETSAAER